MKCAVISFTEAGEKLAKTISQWIPNTDIYSNRGYPAGVKSEISAIFEEYKRIVFVSSVGIAVRLIAPYIKDKTRDPAVVAVDDLGRYAISLLSGHIGGANDLACEIAEAIGAQAVITTASEARGIEAVDMFAQRCGLVIENMEDAKTITSIMVNGGTLRLISEINQQINYPRISETEYDGCLYITSRTAISCDKPYCVLRPLNLTVGVGCRKGKSKEEILYAINTVFKENDLSIKSIDCIASIDIKKEEQGLIQACEELGCNFKTFSKEQINSVQKRFAGSSFVKGAVGVDCVCEPCAYLASGEIIVGKRSLDGVTVSVGRKGYD